MKMKDKDKIKEPLIKNWRISANELLNWKRPKLQNLLF
jgi:hypothetical protein